MPAMLDAQHLPWQPAPCNIDPQSHAHCHTIKCGHALAHNGRCTHSSQHGILAHFATEEQCRAS